MDHEIPVLFNSEGVSGILDGRKSQTRRAVTDRNVGYIGGRDDDHDDPDLWGYEAVDGVWYVLGRGHSDNQHGGKCSIRSPYGQPGDRLWVRETWAVLREYDERRAADVSEPNRRLVWRPVCEDKPEWKRIGSWLVHAGRWRPNIHMPKWACRLWLEVLSVRVERVQDISEQDARAEGVVPLQMDQGSFLPRFEGIWDNINAKRGLGWEKNPWVWVVEFRRTAEPPARRRKGEAPRTDKGT